MQVSSSVRGGPPRPSMGVDCDVEPRGPPKLLWPLFILIFPLPE